MRTGVLKGVRPLRHHVKLIAVHEGGVRTEGSNSIQYLMPCLFILVVFCYILPFSSIQ